MNGIYEEIKGVKELNGVEGFDPKQLMRSIEDVDKNTKIQYLDVAYRKLWFRLKYPEGKICKKVLKLTDNAATIEARIYLNKDDLEENFVANAIVQKFMTSDPVFGNKFVELAETGAVGRALSDAGFGIQFSDLEKDIDPAIVDAGLPVDRSSEALMEESTVSGGSPVEVENDEKNKEPEEVKPKEIKIDNTMTTEEIYKKLTVDYAKTVVISVGKYKGKMLGEMAVEQPNSLDWYANTYGGRDNLLRAAAKYLMDKAKNGAN